MESVFGLVALSLVGALYFLPAIIAHKSKKSNADSVSLLNLLLGWTFIGWVVALVWATAKDTPKATPLPVSATTADELLKLKSLLDAKAITQEEYEAQKAKLLA